MISLYTFMYACMHDTLAQKKVQDEIKYIHVCVCSVT